VINRIAWLFLTACNVGFCSMQNSLSRLLMTLFYHQRNMLMWSFLEEVIIMLPSIWLRNTSAPSLVNMIYAKYIQMFMLFNLHSRYPWHNLSIFILFSILNSCKFIEDPEFCYSPKHIGFLFQFKRSTCSITIYDKKSGISYKRLVDFYGLG